MEADERHDRAVISTADDAVLAKLSCVEKGYYHDAFIQAMAKGVKGVGNNSSSTYGAAGRRNGASSMMEPIIRKGTHARVCAVDKAINAFLSLPLLEDAEASNNKDRRQVVILGAGRDTTYLRYRFGYLTGFEGKEIDWFEVDHPFVIEQKAKSWLKKCTPEGYVYNSKMNVATGDSYRASFSKQQDGTDTNNSTYHLVGHDLRSSPDSLLQKLSDPFHGYNRAIPTIFVLECLIMYLPDKASWNLLQYLANISNCNNKKDAFSRTLSDHLNKLKTCGFDIAVGCNMMDAYEHGIISIDERRRAARCEMLDELEEFVLLMRHYCLCLGAKGSGRYKSAATALCSVGKDSPIGFETGRCERQIALTTLCS
ncbi:hypothetical protein ACHAWC_004004 [Mediolabrus comicus]